MAKAPAATKKLDKGCAQAGCQPRRDDEPVIKRRAHSQPDQRRRHETCERDGPKPKRGIARTAFVLDMPDPDLRQLPEHRHRAHRLFCLLPYSHGQLHSGHQSRAGSRRRIGGSRHGLGALGGEIGNQAFDLVGRHRRWQLQYDGRAGLLGSAACGRRADQEQQSQGDEARRHCGVFKRICPDHQTARPIGLAASRYSVSGCFDGWASAKAGIAMQLS